MVAAVFFKHDVLKVCSLSAVTSSAWGSKPNWRANKSSTRGGELVDDVDCHPHSARDANVVVAHARDLL